MPCKQNFLIGLLVSCVQFWECLMCSSYCHFVCYMVCKYFLQIACSCRLHFHPPLMDFHREIVQVLLRYNASALPFQMVLFVSSLRTVYLAIAVKGFLLCYFFLKEVFKSVIHSELSYCRVWSSGRALLYLPLHNHLLLDHLLKRRPFVCWIAFASSKNQLNMFVQVCFWAL